MEKILNSEEINKLRRWPLIDVSSLEKGELIVITYGREVFELGRSPITRAEELPLYMIKEMVQTGDVSDETLKYHSAQVDQRRKKTNRLYRPHQQDAVFIRFCRNPLSVVVKKWQATSQTFTKERYIQTNTIIGRTEQLRKGKTSLGKKNMKENKCCKCNKTKAVTYLHGHGYCNVCKVLLARILLDSKTDLRPCVHVHLVNHEAGLDNKVFVCLPCFNTSYPEPFYTADIILFEEELIIGESLCEVCNCDVYRL